MGIKEAPITYRTYYKKLIQDYTQFKKDALSALEELYVTEKALYEEVKSNADRYKTQFDINLLKYEEFVNNEYSDGTFVRLAKGAFINRKNDYLLVADLFDLYNLAKKQKDIYNLKKDIYLYDKILDLKLKDYHKILQTFYFEVHKKMILRGYGYVFEDDLGWVCINRCKINKGRPHTDFAATKKKKEEILAKGGRLYNKEEEEWCRRNNIPYNGEKYTVLQKLESCYEIPLIGCKLPNGRKYKLEIADTRGKEIRGKSDEQLAKECNNNLEKICDLNVSLKTKLNICDKIDKTLYTNFIRNENQTPVNARKINRKD